MRVMVLGAGGLIGHKLFQILKADMDVFAVLHRSSIHPLFNGGNVFNNIDVLEFDRLVPLINDHQIDVILNCVGITKRNPAINNLELAIATNAHFPHRLANWAKANGKRVIHFSTDCVFDGTLGDYSECSATTAVDTYGKTKALGEIDYPHTLTIRSSFIGRELTGKTELLEWALSRRGKKIKGFGKAFYSGVSTIFMARMVKSIVTEHKELSGIYQLAAETPISKLELLEIANKCFQLGLEIEPENSFETMPTLKGTKLRDATNIKVPSWKAMMVELASENMYDDVLEQEFG